MSSGQAWCADPKNEAALKVAENARKRWEERKAKAIEQALQDHLKIEAERREQISYADELKFEQDLIRASRKPTPDHRDPRCQAVFPRWPRAEDFE